MSQGLLGRFHEPEPLIAAVRQAREKGYRKLDAFTPFPVEGLDEAIGFHRDGVAAIALLAGIAGAVGGFFMQVYAFEHDLPLNIAGRPNFSWPAFVPVTFELMVLSASLAAAFGMLALNRLPRPSHPVFETLHFAEASKDAFFLLISSDDPIFEASSARVFLAGAGASSIEEVPDES